VGFLAAAEAYSYGAGGGSGGPAAAGPGARKPPRPPATPQANGGTHAGAPGDAAAVTPSPGPGSVAAPATPRPTAGAAAGPATPRPAGAAAAAPIPLLSSPSRRPVAQGLYRLVGREAELARLVQALTEGAAAASPSPSTSASHPFPSSQPQPPSPAVLVSGPRGCGKSALVTAAASRLVASGVWARACVADVRCAAGPEEAALAIALALDLPFYAASRPAAARLLSWLRRHGRALRQGLVLDGVDLLLGLARDDALEAARSCCTAPHTPNASTSSRQLSLAASGPAAAAAAAAASAANGYVDEQGEAAAVRLSPSQLNSEAVDRRRRVLGLLRDVAEAAPGLQLVLLSGPGATIEFLRAEVPQ
ncbi:hypothetical protein TSOC_014853, partial [Tetrabaena socialis]